MLNVQNLFKYVKFRIKYSLTLDLRTFIIYFFFFTEIHFFGEYYYIKMQFFVNYLFKICRFLFIIVFNIFFICKLYLGYTLSAYILLWSLTVRFNTIRLQTLN